jgi:hypothetical protein
MDVQLMTSRDGRDWHRVADRGVFLECTPGAWDQGRIQGPSTTMVLDDDQISVYYSGTDTRHGSGSWGSPGIGLATLPADRFVALVPDNSAQDGVLETKLFTFEGDALLLNADVPEGGLQVELLDDQGNVLPGFDRDNFQLVQKDDLRYWASWGEGYEDPLSPVATQEIAIRFIVEDGALYAFQIVDSPPIAGDLNGDGFVGEADLDILQSFWGQYVMTGSLPHGDPSIDGFVGGDDLDIVRAHWGEGTMPVTTSVPEPGLTMLLTAGMLGLWLIRRTHGENAICTD